MIYFANTEVGGLQAAFRGMRNPYDSWLHSDSYPCKDALLKCEQRDHKTSEVRCRAGGFCIGQKDMTLAQGLIQSGTDHRKFLRMITVHTDIVAPFYWWKEFDTYKVGTVANSCSTMHTICKRPLKLEDFSFEHLYGEGLISLEKTIEIVNEFVELYKAADSKEEKKAYWWQVIQLLPTSYNQRRTVMLNYEVLRNIYFARENHRLDEWHDFRDWVETLPYSELITAPSKIPVF